jgi:type I restriction enzyme M protein
VTPASNQIVQKLWSYCNVLRDDGLSYGDYVEQLTFLLFLKMSHERTQAPWNQKSPIPPGFDWPALLAKDGDALEVQYRHTLETLGKQPGLLGVIFRKAQNKIQDPAKLRRLIVDLIDREEWSSLDADVKGDAYEGLLEKNAQDTKGGAGQYFTPRPLIRAIVDVMQPRPGERISDPACGTGGFLLAAYEYISKQNPRLTRTQKRHLEHEALYGNEIVDGVARLCAMNLILHGIGMQADEAPPIETRDSLATSPSTHFDVVLTNPPFGKKSSVMVVGEDGESSRETLTISREDFWATTSNKQLNFVQHVRTLLKIPGRAAVVVPDNVLFEGGAGETIRRRLLHDCDVHTLLRLPTGIFYAQGVKANVLFFDRKPASETPWTQKLWVYDLRTNQHFTLKTNPLQDADLEEFKACYRPGARADRAVIWSEENPAGRWRAYSYDELVQRDKCSLDVFWLKDQSLQASENLPDPDVIAQEIVEDLRAALEQFEEVANDLTRGSAEQGRERALTGPS